MPSNLFFKSRGSFFFGLRARGIFSSILVSRFLSIIAYDALSSGISFNPAALSMWRVSFGWSGTPPIDATSYRVLSAALESAESYTFKLEFRDISVIGLA